MLPPPWLPTPVPTTESQQPEVGANPPQPVMTAPDQVHLPLRPEQSLPDTHEPIPDTPEPFPDMSQVQGPPTPYSPPGHLARPSPLTAPSAPSSVQNQRPQRVRKPNVRLDPAEWELGKMDSAQQFVPTMDWCLDMIRWIAKQEGGKEGGRR